jgi:hypothetical protein
MATLLPFRDYDEKDVINLFAFSGTLPATKGTLVKVQGNGFKATDEISMLGDVGAAFGNTVSQRYGAAAKVSVAASGEAPLGMMLFDVKETDENGEPLKFNPRKAAEIGCVVSGQVVPVVTRGTFRYSGALGTPAGGGVAYATTAGVITANVTTVAVGKFLGAADADGFVTLKLDL